jgi:hypothetical protein
VLAIIGLMAFGISVFDGFQHTLSGWITRYINIYLWLMVANIFGAIISMIQQKMTELDISQINTQGDTVFGAHDTAYLISSHWNCRLLFCAFRCTLHLPVAVMCLPTSIKPFCINGNNRSKHGRRYRPRVWQPCQKLSTRQKTKTLN